ncbi:MAG TPA: hypothetical protein PKK96_14615 [Anaerolineales bacterium]|nr:hypothetical protein [Anaerolineales bacterium]HNQ94555.1 hypothetical protein [Anaerolineales bacterium]HNS62233.1 hypothetical protein [Anaerolineales bacterium]
MKRSSILTTTLALTLIITACGADASQVTPTINPVDLQSTVVAAAGTLVAETQAAIPTATTPPTATSTNTPPFTATIPPLPTLGATFTASPVPNPYANDPCVNTLLPSPLEGEKIKIRIDNPTKGTINVSVNLQQSGLGSVCGYRGYVLAAGGSLVIGDLIVGCYSLWAWNPDPKDYFMVTNGTHCLDTSKPWAFDITPNGINLKK